MNVTILPSAFHPHIGGVEELSRQLAHELISRRHKTLIATNLWPKTLPESEEYEGLPIRRYAFRVPERTWKQMGGAMLYGPATLNRLCGDLANFGAEVLHVQCVSSNAYYALQAKRRLRLPLVVTLQGELQMDAFRLFERSAFARGLMRSALTEADAITACSQNTLAEAEAFFGQPFGNRACVIYNGVRLADFDSVVPWPSDRPYILGIGRLVPQKGFDVLIRAFSHSAITTHDLVIAGDGVEMDNLRALVEQLGLTKSVRFPGRADRGTAASMFAGCAFFVLPSRHEPLGIVNLEAMAAGKAVIASRVGGVPEIVQDNITGLLTPPDNIEKLSAAIRDLAADHALNERLGQAARESVRAFDWPAIAARYDDVYRAVVH